MNFERETGHGLATEKQINLVRNVPLSRFRIDREIAPMTFNFY